MCTAKALVCTQEATWGQFACITKTSTEEVARIQATMWIKQLTEYVSFPTAVITFQTKCIGVSLREALRKTCSQEERPFCAFCSARAADRLQQGPGQPAAQHSTCPAPAPQNLGHPIRSTCKEGCMVNGNITLFNTDYICTKYVRCRKLVGGWYTENWFFRWGCCFEYLHRTL